MSLHDDMLKCRDLLAVIERTQDEFDGTARGLESAATARLAAQHQLRRTGMRAHLREISEADGVPHLYFDVSNGRDKDDDFGVTFTLEELSEDIEQLQAREETQRQAKERKRLVAEQQRVARQLAQLDGEATA